VALHGQPKSKLPSKYNFEWWVYYDESYQSYYQLGLSDGKLVAVYTPSVLDHWPYDVKVGMPKADDSNAPQSSNASTLNYDIKVYYDKYKTNQVNSILIRDLDYLRSDIQSAFLNQPTLMVASFEKQIFHINNAMRAKFGLTPLVWHEELSTIARTHSQDMATNNFFSHNNLKGESPFDRMKNAGITYSRAAENIAAGQTSAIEVMDTWMNSEGHRKNILSDITHLGVGVYYDTTSTYRIYHTQKFVTPRP